MRRSFEIGQSACGVTVLANSGKSMYCVSCSSGHKYTLPSWHIARLFSGAIQSHHCKFCNDLTGSEFGRLVVLRKSKAKDKWFRSLWACKCQCGRIVAVPVTKLKHGLKQSCGRVGCRIGTSHGLSKKSRAYTRWKTMMARCYNERNESFYRYGSRGIKVCERWHSFVNFLSDMGEPPNGTALDRVNFDGDYSPRNCRWATFKQSTQNRSNTVWVGGSRVEEIAKLYNMPVHRVYSRIRHGWSLADIVKYPKAIKHGYFRNGKPSNPHDYKSQSSGVINCL